MSDEKDFYVSNKELYEHYAEWYSAIATAREEGIEDPQIPDFIVSAMMKIASRLSYKPNFINYTFKEDFISDALYDCVRFSKQFKLTYTDKAGVLQKGNPFSYITTICFNAFLRRIDKEKTQKYIKAQLVRDSLDLEFIDMQSEDDSNYVNQYIKFLQETGYAEDSVPMSMKRTVKYKKENQIGLLNDTDEK